MTFISAVLILSSLLILLITLQELYVGLLSSLGLVWVVPA